MVLSFYANAVLIGIGATAFMDLVALAQRYFLAQQSLNYAMVGRWLGHVLRGRFVHRPISASEPVILERAIGWGAHYLIGVSFAAIFLLFMGQDWLIFESLTPALIFGGMTVLAPFLIIQPGMGAGLAARCLPNPTVARFKTVLAHLSFGFGMWLTAIFLSGLQ
ncbi:Protein of unknown function (DUF2938) [Yoonia maricola]|uniref:DUF2938 family protein n=1 Tax=Yoonia maricola TaxID=420999 RepID=A0A2M8W0X0_9RHOB|nr:DUF2938 domain-containing protein [Yoonia maricola]PJI84570.1 Protein of unknown function (DUF2938) [Yoonia maricola]